MIWLISLVIFGLTTPTVRNEIFEPGPNSGIVLKAQPRLLITNCRLHMKKVFVRFDPKTECQQNVPTTARLASWAGVQWNKEVITQAEIDITHMLDQLRKFTVTRDELSRLQKREKWFIGGLQKLLPPESVPFFVLESPLLMLSKCLPSMWVSLKPKCPLSKSR